MVCGQAVGMERQVDHPCSSPVHPDHRRLSSWLGRLVATSGSLRPSQRRGLRLLLPSRVEDVIERLRVDCCLVFDDGGGLPSYEPRGVGRERQHHDQGLHRPHGRAKPLPLCHCALSRACGPSAQHSPLGGAPPTGHQSTCRQAQSMEVRLHRPPARPCSFLLGRPLLGSALRRPLRQPAQHAAALLCLMAARASSRSCRCVSLPADWLDALCFPPEALDWLDALCFPPEALISRLLSAVICQRATITLVAPLWPSWPWWPYLQLLRVDEPLILHAAPTTLRAVAVNLFSWFQHLKLAC